jgi:hypothetical protein
MVVVNDQNTVDVIRRHNLCNDFLFLCCSKLNICKCQWGFLAPIHHQSVRSFHGGQQWNERYVCFGMLPSCVALIHFIFLCGNGDDGDVGDVGGDDGVDSGDCGDERVVVNTHVVKVCTNFPQKDFYDSFFCSSSYYPQ